MTKAKNRIIRATVSSSSALAESWPISNSFWSADQFCIRRYNFFCVGVRFLQLKRWLNIVRRKTIHHRQTIGRQIVCYVRVDRSTFRHFKIFLNVDRQRPIDDRK